MAKKVSPAAGNKKRHWGIVVAGIVSLLCIAVVAWYLYARHSPRQYYFEKGVAYRYAFDYAGDSEAVFMKAGAEGSSVTGATNAKLTYTLTPIIRNNEGWLVALSFDEIENFSFIYNGNELFEDDSSRDFILKNRTAAVTIAPDGKVGRLYFKPNEDVVFQSTVKMILGDVQTVIAEKQSSWSGEEQDQTGSYEARYTIGAETDKTFDMTKTIARYTKIIPTNVKMDDTEQKNDSSLAIVWSKKGRLESLSGAKKLTVTGREGQRLFTLDAKYSCRFLEAKKVSTENTVLAQALSSWRSSAIGTVTIDEAARKKMLEKRAQNMTRAEMMESLRSYAADGTMYEKGFFLWRVTAYLELHPEDSKTLESLFAEKEFGEHGRMFVLGILASVEHPEAQTSLRSILSHDSAKQDRYYSVYVQQIMQVKNPDERTVAFTEEFYRTAQAQKKLQNAAALTMGGIAGKLRKSGNESAALRLNNELTVSLSQAKSPKEQERLLDALGNAGFDANIAIAASYRQAADPVVRASVANAIRYVQNPESEELLFDLITDRDPTVKMNAINTLAEYRLSPPLLDKLHSYISDGTIPADNYLGLIQVLAGYGASNQNVRGILETMQKKPFHNPEVRSRLNSMLQGKK